MFRGGLIFKSDTAEVGSEVLLDDAKSPKVEAKTEAKTEAKPPTFFERLVGTPYNTHIPYDRGIGLFAKAAFKRYGLSTIAKECFEAKKMATWVGPTPVLFISDPTLIQQVLTNADKLSGVEVGSVQRKLLARGKKTLVSMPLGKEMREIRQNILHYLYTNIAKHAHVIQTVMRDTFEKISEYKEDVPLVNVALMTSMTIIGHLLGIDRFSLDPVRDETNKLRLARIVERLSVEATNPVFLSSIYLEDAIEWLVSKRPNLTPWLDKFMDEGEAIIKQAIRLTPANVLERLKEIKIDKILKKEIVESDLYSDDMMAIIKLILIGAFDTTNKVLTHGMIMMGNPDNAAFLEEMRKECIEQEIDFKKDIQHDDLNRLPKLSAWVSELLRFVPSFAYVRKEVQKEFTLASNLSISSTEAECKKKLEQPRDTSRDILVKQNTIIIMSIIGAHRDPKMFTDGDQFDPRRWANVPLNLDATPSHFQIFTFGHGARPCPGRKLAFDEARFLTLHLLPYQISHNMPKKLPLEEGFLLRLKSGITPMGQIRPIARLTEEKDKATPSLRSHRML